MADSEVKPDSTQKPARPRRRWYQFSLRTACALLLVASLLLGAFAWWRDRAERQRKVVLGRYDQNILLPLLRAFAPSRDALPNQKASREDAEARRGKGRGERRSKSDIISP